MSYYEDQLRARRAKSLEEVHSLYEAAMEVEAEYDRLKAVMDYLKDIAMDALTPNLTPEEVEEYRVKLIRAVIWESRA